MISIQPIIERVSKKPLDFEDIWFKGVGGTAAYASINPHKIPAPYCWLVNADNPAKPLGRLESEGILTFSAVVSVSNVRTHEAGDTDEMLLQYRNAIYKLLQGFKTEHLSSGLSWRGGRTLQNSNTELVYADKYQAPFVITNYLPDPPPFEAVTHKPTDTQ